MFDTLKIHSMLDCVQGHLGQWLESHLKQVYPSDWWDKCVMSVLVPEQRERVLEDGARKPTDLDLSTQISVFRGNFQSLRRRFHLNPQLYDDAAAVKRIRNKYSHKKSGLDYEERFGHDMEAVRLFLKGLGASDDLLNEKYNLSNGSHNHGDLKTADNQNGVTMPYCDRINEINPISFDAVIDAARRALPVGIRKAPWIGLEHGVVPLDSEQRLDQYLAAYGKMYVEKLRMAFEALESQNEDLRTPVSVIDWGCGQALATCSFLDWLLEENNIGIGCIRRLHLIEPSNMALTRALANVNAYQSKHNADFSVKSVNKFINDVRLEDFEIGDMRTTVHLFSNVLDMETINLDLLAGFIKHSFTGRQIFFCVGPLNQDTSRILEFAERFGISKDDILKKCKGRLTQHGTISVLTFVIEDRGAYVKKGNIVSTAPVAAQDQDNIALQRVLNRPDYVPKQDIMDRIIQFYQMSTELEQIKEPDVKNVTSFPFIEDNGILRVFFGNNKDFIEQCRKNADPKTKWPKDFHFGLDVIWGEKVYRLLYFIKPMDELKNMNFSTDTIGVRLQDFAVSIGCAESLELSDEKVTDIERFLHSTEVTWTRLAELIEQVIGNGATLSRQQINVSFCEKNIALAQTYSELKKMDSPEIGRNPLLAAFLENAEIDNAVDSISPEEIISIVPMDDSQRKAVCCALNNRMSVVVGPPGCGKTQLILNLLANSLVYGKKVLVASKNNKAVDNVKDRFASFDPNGSFLRFGTKNVLRDDTCPKIDELLNIVQQQSGYNDQPYVEAVLKLKEIRTLPSLREEQSIYQEDKFSAETRIHELQGEIDGIDNMLKNLWLEFQEQAKERLAHEITQYEVKKQNEEQSLTDITAKLAKLTTQDLDYMALELVTTEALSKSEEKLRRLCHEIDHDLSGFKGFFVHMFGRAKLVRRVFDSIVGFDIRILDYLKKKDVRSHASDFRNCNEVVKFCSKIDRALIEVLIYRDDRARLLEMRNKKEQSIHDVNRKMSELKTRLDDSCSLRAYITDVYHLEILRKEQLLTESKNELQHELEVEREKCKGAISRIDEIEGKLHHIRELAQVVATIDFGRRAVGLSFDHYLHANGSAKAISAYKAYIPDNVPWRHCEIPKFVQAAERFLDVSRLSAVTSLSVKNAFPRKAGLFDLLVIDEASQCDVASALPLIFRAKQVVVIGDPMQLRHISRVEPEEELAIKRHLNLSGAVHLKNAEISLWDYARNWLPWCGCSIPCILENHYRCHPDIIGYSNEMFYKNLTFGGLNVCTPNRPMEGMPQGVIWKDIKGKQLRETMNVNIEEVNEALKLASKYARLHETLTVGIVTPFKAQAERINNGIPDDLRTRIVADTVHKFQGDEKDVMIYSLVVTDNSPDGKIKWIDSKIPNLVNVAVTRARQLLVVIGNKSYVRSHSRSNLPLGYLVDYIDKINTYRNNKVGS